MSAYKMLEVTGQPFMDAYGVNLAEVVVGAAPVDDKGTYHAFGDFQKMSAGSIEWIGGWVDLNPPGAERSFASAVNGRGSVVGSFDIGGIRHGFTYQAGTFVDLNAVLGASWSSATDINDRGQVVGGAVFGPSGDVAKCHAFLYDPAAAQPVKDLGTLPGAPASWASAININGQIVGWSGDVNDGSGHPFLFSGGAMQDLTGQPGSARGINDKGEVLVNTVDLLSYPATPGWYSFIWRNGQAEIIPGDTWGRAINNLGQVVGEGFAASGQLYGFVYDSSGLRDLNNLITDPGPWHVVMANAINDQGDIGVEVLDSSNSSGGAVLLVRDRRRLKSDLEALVSIIAGTIEDGGGIARRGKHKVPIGPWGPKNQDQEMRAELAAAFDLLAAAESIKDPKVRDAVQTAARAIIERFTRGRPLIS